MTDILMSDREIKIKPKIWGRLIPEPGFLIQYKDEEYLFLDVNDTNLPMQEAFDGLSRVDIYPNDCRQIEKGETIAKRFRVFIFISGQPMTVYTLTEYIGSKFGFDPGECCMSKYVYPEFQGTMVGRVVSISFILMVLLSGKIRKIYSFMKAREDGQFGAKWTDILEAGKNPCLPQTFDDDNSQSFVSASRLLDAPTGKFVLVYWDREMLQGIDVSVIINSLAAKHNVSTALITAWLNKIKTFSESIIYE